MYKQAIVVRNDLKLGKGKLAGQCAHASVSAYILVRSKKPEIAKEWELEGQKKIVLKVNSEEELLDYLGQVKRAGIPPELIRDAGKTQIEPGTITCFGAGPWDEKEIDKILGKLKLL
ncbi:peptidyl-tRNA hydrolase [Candidatus Micrarchaeota archaeon]|nr:peptidyl-tRNA hydrolase [Candidatus Micrarchaeota archaeon]